LLPFMGELLLLPGIWGRIHIHGFRLSLFDIFSKIICRTDGNSCSEYTFTSCSLPGLRPSSALPILYSSLKIELCYIVLFINIKSNLVNVNIPSTPQFLYSCYFKKSLLFNTPLLPSLKASESCWCRSVERGWCLAHPISQDGCRPHRRAEI
jgi:hypothetical protein